MVSAVRQWHRDFFWHYAWNGLNWPKTGGQTVNEIKPGALVAIRTADDRRLHRRAASGVVAGLDFPVVWICKDEEWEAAQADSREPDAVPWPAEDVSLDGS